MDHLAVKIEINNTAVRTLTAQLQFNLTVEDTTKKKKKKNISEPDTLCKSIKLCCQPAINDTKHDLLQYA